MVLRYGADGASSRVRGIELAAALGRRGVEVAVLTPDDPAWRRRFYTWAASPHPLYLQKRASDRDVAVARARRTLRLPTIFDIDDAPGGVAEDPAQEARVETIMGLVSSVTVGGHALSEFAARHNDTVAVVPSAVDTAVYAPAPCGDRPFTVGWIGNGAGYVDELADLARIVARVRARTEVRVVIVGAMGRREIHAAFAHAHDTVVDAIDWTREETIVDAMRAFDAGAYPLRDTRYNAFKCGYKAIQYMALGQPVVASPVGETTRIVRAGGSGYLPVSEDEWVDALAALADDAARRESMGRAGRAIVEESYSMERAAGTLHALLDRL
jgi:glycosyltransferase involved in cell wall biosynthesis